MNAENPWPDLAGRLVPGGHILPVRVYFEDTDFTGFVYHGSYIRFMERGRSDFIRCLGVNHHDLDAGLHGEPLAFAVRHMDIDFLKPARIDDLLEVRTHPIPGTGVRLMLRQSIHRGAETLVEAKLTVVAVTAAGKPRRLPDALREQLGAGVAKPAPAIE